PSSENKITPVDLRLVLDELRILIETSFGEAGVTVYWKIPDHLPLVWADRYGLLQVFLNITKNSLRAMQATVEKELIMAPETGDAARVHFEDPEPGIRNPDRWFRPFQFEPDMPGLALYTSKPILQTFHVDLRSEPRPHGSCFTATLMAATAEA